jgi:hypothetical protein
MKYLCLVYPGADFVPTQADVPGYVAVRDAMADAGAYVDSGALQPAGSATTLHGRDGGYVLTDGPFAEMGEHVGGYFLLDCPNLDEAVRWAATIPVVARHGSVEIRPVVDLMPPGRE